MIQAATRAAISDSARARGRRRGLIISCSRPDGASASIASAMAVLLRADGIPIEDRDRVRTWCIANPLTGY